MKIILATQNLGKLKEFQQLSKGKNFEFIPMPEDLKEMPEETGSTFKENAFIKAKYVSEYFEMPALADDSGLEVDALNGAPGIFSARYSSLRTDLSNSTKLLRDMKGVEKENRTARFRCCLLGFHKGKTICSEGTLEGEVAESFKGDSGFGYDPIFEELSSKLTFAEMNNELKDLCSHRGKALKKIIPDLLEIFS